MVFPSVLTFFLAAFPSGGEVAFQELDLTEISLEELMNIEVEVTSVSRKSQQVARSPAAVYVITGEDIRRSGATSIMEALRLAPGMGVARIDASSWAISARGFNGLFANKMLVLIDGRSVYTPLFSGVYWHSQDVVLEDVERIEVIRGPGAAMWGANAVNGVINIITKEADDTVGWLASGRVGNEELGALTVRHGTRTESGAWRAYVKAFRRDGSEDTGGGIDDAWGMGQAGFRGDWSADEDGVLTLQGDVFYNRTHSAWPVVLRTPPFADVVDSDGRGRGGNVLARWTVSDDDRSESSVQAYLDHIDQDSSLAREVRDTLDLDFQQRFDWTERTELTWGLGYRLSDYDFDSTTFVLDPDSDTNHLFSAFAQLETEVVEDTFWLVAGSKLEHNDFSGFELQPTARAVWASSEEQTVWAAVSRAVRSPAATDESLTTLLAFVPDMGMGFDTEVVLMSDDAEAENLLAYELGWRRQLGARVSLDAALFYNDYDDLIVAAAEAPFFADPGTMIQPFVLQNAGAAEAYGAEVAVQWNARENWTLHGSYSFLEVHTEAPPGALDGDGAESASPEQTVHARSYLDLGEDWELDAGLWWVDRLPGGVPDYVRGDVRLGWRASDEWDLSLTAQGLGHDGEREFDDDFLTIPAEMSASVFFEATWRP